MGRHFKNREALIVTFWRSFDEHELSHRSETFQSLFKNILGLCENGNEKRVYAEYCGSKTGTRMQKPTIIPVPSCPLGRHKSGFICLQGT